MTKKRDKKDSNIFKITFAATFIISLIILGFYFTQILFQPTQHLPDDPTFSVPDWMKFVSDDTDKVLTLNFTKIYQKSGNYSLFSSTNILIVYGITNKITTSNTEIIASILYPNPVPDSDELSLNIIKPEEAVYSIIRNEIEGKNLTKYYHLNYTIYQIIRVTESEPAFSTGYLTFDNGYILYSESIGGLDVVKKSLNNKKENNQFAKKNDVRDIMYLLLSGKGDELGYSYSKLPYSVNTTTTVSSSVRYENNLVLTRQIFQFSNTTIAKNSLNNIKQANLNSYEITIIENYILANSRYDKTLLLYELRLL